MAKVHDKDVKPSAKELDSYSSSDGAEYDEPPSYQEVSAMKGKRFDFDFGSFPWRDVTIQDSNSSNVGYFADVSRYSSFGSSPDVALHARNASGPVVGEARFRMSRSIKCGLGSNESSMDWVDVKRSGALQRRYHFQYNSRAYSLLRTRDAENGVEGMHLLATNYKVVDEVSGEVVAIYNSQSALGKRKGTLTFKDAISQNLEVLVILTVLSVREKAKRRAQFGASAGAGAGSAA